MLCLSGTQSRRRSPAIWAISRMRRTSDWAVVAVASRRNQSESNWGCRDEMGEVEVEGVLLATVASARNRMDG